MVDRPHTRKCSTDKALDIGRRSVERVVSAGFLAPASLCLADQRLRESCPRLLFLPAIFATGTPTTHNPRSISCLAFGRGGNLLCGTSSGEILVWNETAVLEAMAAHGGAVLSLVVSAESGHVFSGGADGAVKQCTELQEPAGQDVVVNGSVRALGFGPDGTLFVGTSLCEILKVDMLREGSAERVFQVRHPSHHPGFGLRGALGDGVGDWKR